MTGRTAGSASTGSGCGNQTAMVRGVRGMEVFPRSAVTGCTVTATAEGFGIGSVGGH